jgi:DNA-binding IclR family transcriptional regulator
MPSNHMHAPIILTLLCTKPPHTVTEIALATGQHRTSISQRLASMQAQGLVRRAGRYRVTPQGLATLGREAQKN